MNARAASLLALLVSVSFPFLLWYSRGRIEPRWLALVLVAVVALRAAALWRDRYGRLLLMGVALLAVAAFALNASAPLRFYPVAVNVAMLFTFGSSLLYPPTVIERLARLTEPDLSLDGVRYTRQVTVVWCIFFVINGSIAFATAFASEQVWMLYNGLISYLLMGTLFAAEFVTRQRVRARHV